MAHDAGHGRVAGAAAAVDLDEHAQDERLAQGLKQRHMTLIALGGVIGAGLFVGSGAVIGELGPAAVISYLLAGIVLVLVMRMLGEMAVAHPVTGSFAEYAREAIGGWAGFSIGWLYWYFWVVVVAIEAVAGAAVLQHWFPGVPLWVFCLGLMLLLTATNLISVSSFGEFEFWFAGIKVVAIVLFIAMGLIYVLGLWPGTELSFANLTSHGGFAPAGIGASFTGITIVIFAFVGAEIVTIAAAESVEPERAVARAVNSVIGRVLAFYVLSVLLVVTILPWNDQKVLTSPFVRALEVMGIPAAAEIMNAIVLTAVLSCLNSGLYTSSRMLFALAKRGDAPRGFLDVNARGVPVKAILIGMSFGYLAVIAAIISPEGLFLFLVNASGAIALLVYLMVAISELRLRRVIEQRAPERLTLKMWAYPWLTWVTIVAISAVLISMAMIEATRTQFFLSLVAVAVALVAYAIRVRAGRAVAGPTAPEAA